MEMIYYKKHKAIDEAIKLTADSKKKLQACLKSIANCRIAHYIQIGLDVSVKDGIKYINFELFLNAPHKTIDQIRITARRHSRSNRTMYPSSNNYLGVV